MSRKLVVEIVGDPTSLQRALGKASASADSFGSRVQSAGSKIAGVGKNMTIAGAAITGVTGLIGKSLVDSAMKAQEETGKLDVAFRNAGLSAEKLRPQIDGVESSARRLGFTNSDVRDSLTRLVQSGESLTAATKDIALAQDYARSKGIPLADATNALVKVHQGLLRPLKELGISLPAVTTHMDALKKAAKASGDAITYHQKAVATEQDKLATGRLAVELMTQKLHGQADEYSKSAAGGMAVFHAQMDNIKERMGTSLLPIVVKLTDFLSKLADKFSSLSPHTQKMIALGVAAAAGLGLAVTVMGTLTTAIGGLVTGLGFLIANPIVLAIAGIVALAAAVAAAVLWPDKLRSVLEKMGLSAHAAGEIISGLQEVFAVVKDAGEALVGVVRDNWSSISAIISGAVDIVRTVIKDAVVVVTALWSTFGGTLTSMAKTYWGYIKDTVKNALEIIHGIIDVVTGLIHGDWSKVWKGIQEIVGGALGQIENYLHTGISLLGNLAHLIGEAVWKGIIEPIAKLATELLHKIEDGIRSAINTIIGWASGEAQHIGKAIIDGIIHGAEGLAGGLGKKLEDGAKSAFHAATSFLGINSPSLLFSDGVGKPIAEGIEYGYVIGSASLPSKISASLRAALEAAKQTVDNYRSTLQTSWQQLASDADTAFDGVAAKLKTKSDKLLNLLVSSQDAADFKANMAQAQAALASAFSTADLGNRSDQVAAALAKMQAAQETYTAAVAAYGAASKQAATAQQGLIGATANAQVLTSGEQPGTQQGNDQAVIDAQKNLNALLLQQEDAALQKKADKERLDLDARLALKKRHMDDSLASLLVSLQKEGASHQQAQERIMALLASYGVRYKASGIALGNAFAQGLRESLAAVEKAAQELADAASKYLPHSPAEKGPLSKPIGWASYLMGGLAPAAAGVTAALAAGLAAPALAVPSIPVRPPAGVAALASGGSSGVNGGRPQINVTVKVDGWVGSDQDLAYRMRDELLKIARSEPNIFGGRA